MSLLPLLPSHSETFSNAGDYQYITKVVQIEVEGLGDAVGCATRPLPPTHLHPEMHFVGSRSGHTTTTHCMEVPQAGVVGPYCPRGLFSPNMALWGCIGHWLLARPTGGP